MKETRGILLMSGWHPHRSNTDLHVHVPGNNMVEPMKLFWRLIIHVVQSRPCSFMAFQVCPIMVGGCKHGYTYQGEVLKTRVPGVYIAISF